ncbi:MAG TPA: type I-U CRISPR-associated helicase/endonuclease Cas3 [Candidatus Sulfotelmatobacter sp.]|nr:type I-U CRISPR-associated helicase/endonuclease Cas3 [Candidatus Sulfotelmatobacter sp.]
MTPLVAGDFPAFFREMNDGHAPFPWQERLALQVFQERRWPKCLDLPTASGKTAVLDIAIFHLALEARLLGERRAPVRIAFMVDRRLIVDQAQERAKHIKCLLEQGDGVAGRVAAGLKSLAGEGSDPLVVQALRGGLPRESDWARTPVQPTVLLSTVDQVGSRLLFRGYGISKSMRPIHAGLLGSDCLIFLDEAHLSEPFRQSLESVRKYRGENSGPWDAVTLSATPGETNGEPFRLAAEDRTNPALSKRLHAAKPAELREIPNSERLQAYAAAAREMQAREGIDRVLIVVNRVDLARAIFEELGTEDAILLTGRVRELDRDVIVQKLDERFSGGGKFFAVATQCIEAGVDRDFDALVTQIAPIDALRQRFGRLNRTGRDIDAQAIILATKEDISKKPDPIYGEAPRKTWEVLKKIAVSENKKLTVDFGAIAITEKLTPDELIGCSTKRADAPVMPPAYVDLWTCTNPPPSIEPDLSLFLHGPERTSADVELVWRADVVEENFNEAGPILSLVPPRVGETLAIPVWKVRDWLAGKSAGAITDLEGEIESDHAEWRGGRRALRWHGSDENLAELVWPNEIRPGDVIVVPASYGGCDEWGWTGKPQPAVVDKALEAAARLRRSSIAIRLHRNLFTDEDWGEIGRLIEAYYEDPRELLNQLKKLDHLTIHAEISEIRDNTVECKLYDDEDPLRGILITGLRIKGRGGEASTESDRFGSFGQQVSLSDHARSVAAKTTQFARAAGLPAPVLRALTFAAELHDSGKGDGRFQAWLYDGIKTGEVLAKSGRRLTKPQTLPEHWRHEALSVRIAIGHPRFSSEADLLDRELALWLIGTHHGWGRPFFPHDDRMDDSEREIKGANQEVIKLSATPGPQRLDFDWNGLDWASLFALLQRRYGPWELARFESILRLADHRASEEGNVEHTHTAGFGS